MERYCVFDVGSRRVALPMDVVRETIPRVELAPMILTADFVLGLFALRGEVFSVLSLESFIGIEESEELPAPAVPNLLVIERGPVRFAVPVRRISSVEVDLSQLEPHPQSALYPVLQARASDSVGPFEILEFDRLQASLPQALAFDRLFHAA
jgi:chemotaxis signal transduction protein